MWEGVIHKSIARFEPIEESYQNEIADLKEELEKYKNNNQRWQKLFNQWQQEKSKLDNNVLTLEQALEFSQKENASSHAKHDALLQQLQEKQARIDELHRLHTQTQNNLEHYRETMREQRLLDQHQYEQQKQQLQVEIKALSEQLMLQREKISSIQQDYRSIQKTYVLLEKNYAEEKSKYISLHTQYEDNEKIKNEYVQSSQYWQNRFNELQKNSENKISEFINAQSEIKTLLQKINDTKQLLQDTQSQNKLLANEKWSLAQEKAQLEGQIRQMQKKITV